MENQEYNAEIQMVWKINVTCSDQCYGWKKYLKHSNARRKINDAA